MKLLKDILNESKYTQNSTSNYDIKVGDRIKVIRGNMMSGVVTKIEGNQIYFDHATAKYQTVWSGAKDKPKQYVAHISNVVKESYKKVNESFSKQHLDALRNAYNDLEKLNPTSHAYKKLINLLNSLSQDKLKSLVDAKIKFVSLLAKNRIKKDVSETIIKLEDGKYRLLSHDGKNLGTFDSKQAAEKHEQEVQFFKHKAEDRCWAGYKPTPGVKAYEKGSCMKEQDDIEEDAEYDGKKVTLNKPFRTPNQDKKFAVYVRNDKGNIVKVTFGDPNMEIKRDNPERRKSYRARHNCSDPGPKWKANYWSCKMWSDKPVSDIVEAIGDKYYVSWVEPEKTFLKRAGMKFPVHKEFSSSSEVDSYLSRWLMKDPQSSINLEIVKNFFPTKESGRNDYGIKILNSKDKAIYRDTKSGFKKKHKLKDIFVEINGVSRLIGNVVRSIKTDGSDNVVVESINTFDFVELSDSKTQRKLGEIKGLKGNSPEEALKNRFLNSGYTNVEVLVNSDVINVVAKRRDFKEKTYYKLNQSISEAAPPDAEIEKWITANKERFKKQYGSEKGLSVLYAKAWDMYNKK